MSLMNHIETIDKRSSAFDVEMKKADILTESVFQSQDIAKDNLELDTLEFMLDESAKEDRFAQIIQESSEKISDILASTRKTYEDYNQDIDNTIKEKIVNDKTDALFNKIRTKLKTNPDKKNRKVEIHDVNKELNIIYASISNTEKMIAKIKAAKTQDVLKKEIEAEIDNIHAQCQKDRKKVGTIEVTADQIMKSLVMPAKIDQGVLTYEKDILKMSSMEGDLEQEKARVMLKAHLNIVKMAKEARSVELHADIEQLKKLKSIFSTTVKESTEIEEEIVSEAVVNDRKISKIESQISSAIASIKTYIRVAKSISKNPALRGTTPAELKGYVKECESVISELRINRQKLKDAVKKAKLGSNATIKEKIFGDTEVNTVLDSIKQSFASVKTLRKKMNKFSRPNRKIVRNIKTVEVIESSDDMIYEDEMTILESAISDIFSLS